MLSQPQEVQPDFWEESLEEEEDLSSGLLLEALADFMVLFLHDITYLLKKLKNGMSPCDKEDVIAVTVKTINNKYG